MKGTININQSTLKYPLVSIPIYDSSSLPKYKLSIDTIYLIKKLTIKERQFIRDRFQFKRGNKYFRQTLHFHKIGVRINLSPKRSELHRNFNAQIQLHKGFFTSDIPDSIMEVILQMDWSVTRFDLSYDFKTEMKDSILFKHHKRIKDSGKKYENETYYLGSYHVIDGKKQRKSIIHYDRNIRERKRNNPVLELYGNRMEVKIRFPMKMKLHQMDHSLIKKELKRYRFVSDIDAMDTGKCQRNRIRKMQMDDEMEVFLSYPAKEQKKIRQVLRDNREPLEEYYSEHIERLFSPFKAVQDKPQAVTTVLHPTIGQFIQRNSTAGRRYLYAREGGTTYGQQAS